MAAILNFRVTLTLNIKKYYYYERVIMEALSKDVILSILDAYIQMIR